MARKIQTSRARIGDVLAEDVKHGEGGALLAAGTRLEKSHLDLLRQRGVMLVTLEEEEGQPEKPAPRELDPEELKAIVIEQSRWFGETRKDELMAEVFRFAIQKRAREKQTQ